MTANRLPTLLLCLCGVTADAAAQNTFTPAAFGDGEKSLAALIEFPELRGDASVTISCITVVTAKGKLDKHGCYQVNPGDETFIAAIYKAAKKARLTPATYDGKASAVVLQYRIQFVQKGEDRILSFAANPGYEENVDAYGADHVAAQRLMDKEKWRDACPKQARFLVFAKANVDYDGTPSSASLTHADGIPITAKCQQAIIDSLLASRFIPAMADGEPVPSTFIEPFGN